MFGVKAHNKTAK